MEYIVKQSKLINSQPTVHLGYSWKFLCTCLSTFFGNTTHTTSNKRNGAACPSYIIVKYILHAFLSAMYKSRAIKVASMKNTETISIAKEIHHMPPPEKNTISVDVIYKKSEKVSNLI